MPPSPTQPKAGRVALRAVAIAAAAAIVGAAIFEAGWFALRDQRPEWQWEVRYIVQVSAPAGAAYTIRVPGFVDPFDRPAPWQAGLSQTWGDLTELDLIQADHGLAFSWTGNGSAGFHTSVEAPSWAAEPTDMRVPFPGENYGMATGPANGSQGAPTVWIWIDGGTAEGPFSVSASVHYPADHCWMHWAHWHGAGTAGWHEVAVEMGQCPPPP